VRRRGGDGWGLVVRPGQLLRVEEESIVDLLATHPRIRIVESDNIFASLARSNAAKDHSFLSIELLDRGGRRVRRAADRKADVLALRNELPCEHRALIEKPDKTGTSRGGRRGGRPSWRH